MSERNINSNIKTALVSNDDFVYAHLIKFERPFDPKDGEFRTDANRYGYYTDGATDIVYGGNTYRANRVLSVGNYSETTQARATSMKLTLAGENISAKITLNGAITVSGSEGTFTPSSTIHNGETLDFVEEGFREGDQITFTYSSTTKTFVITSFTTNNTVIKFARTGTDTDDSTLAAVSTTSFTIELDSEELKGITRDRISTVSGVIASSPEFINREVFIDKIFINPDDGSILGDATITIFKGIIASVDINESPTGTKVNWSLTSHWGDFAAIQGRMTTDETHRALNANQEPQPETALRREYAADLGFLHSETSLSAIANYQTQETRFRMKSKKRGGFAGLMGGRKYYQEEYQVDIQHEVDLNVHLQGKHLPVVYGVQRISGNPIFADTLNNDSKIIYTAHTLCEGEIHGLYNIYIDDVPLICTDDNDFDVRNQRTGTDKDNTQLQCYGNMSHGATIGGEKYDGTSIADTQTVTTSANQRRTRVNPKVAQYVTIANSAVMIDISGAVTPVIGTTQGSGLGHDEVWSIDHPYNISSHFFAGRPNQRASGILVEPAISNSKVLGIRVINKGSSYESAPQVSISGGGGSGATATAYLGSDATDDAGKVRYIVIDTQGSGYTSAPTVSLTGGGGSGCTAVADLGGYKRQNNYYDGNLPYWSSNHRLLDTAYSAFKFEIDADSTSIPEIEYVVKGKMLQCYNYDNTYAPDFALNGSDSDTNFDAGDLVTVEYSTDGSSWTTDTSGNHASGKFKIMDKYLFTTNRNVSFMKFRLDKTPNLSFNDGVPARTRLRLKNSSNQYWHMITWNHAVVPESANQSFPDFTVSATAGVNGSGELQFSSISDSEKVTLGDTSGKTTVQFYDPAWYDDSDSTNDDVSGLKYGLLEGTWSTSGGDNILTFPNTDYTGATFNQSIKLLNAFDMDFTGISAIENAVQNELQQTFVQNSTLGVTSTFPCRGALLTNLTTGESREVRAFSAGNDIITLDNPFFTPCLSSHKFKLDSKGSDLRASLNPAMQTLDYLTNKRYGKGLLLSEVDLSSFIDSAKLCDTRSDVEMKVASTSNVAVGDIFQLTADGNSSGAHVASGTVLSTGTDSDGNPAVTFTDVVNKFAKEYATRTALAVGDITFTEDGNFYRATATINTPSSTVPTHTSGTVENLEYVSSVTLHKVSGSGSANTLSMTLNRGIPIEYSLYDSDFVKYWRYLGWERNHQAEVTRHQTNFILDTSKSVFANTNALLSHFNGILSYENGKYVLSVETQETAPSASLNSSQENINPYFIEEKDIIGPLKVVDNSQKMGKNTIKASIADPQNNYGSRAVTFFNSDFLKADRGVVKTGTFPYTGITNYYNARIGTEKELIHTRFSKEISFELGPKAILLRAGQVFGITYEPFGWTNKLFRIENLNFRQNCNVLVKAREYDDSIYAITKQRKQKIISESSPDFDGKAPGAPLSLTATTDKSGSIILDWENNAEFIEGSDSTEIFISSTNDRTAATLLTVVDNATTFTYTPTEAVTRYFWIRHRRIVPAVTGTRTEIARGNFFPTSATGGVQGISTSISAGATTIKLIPTSHVIDYSVVGAESTTVSFTTITQGMEGTIFYEFLVGNTTKQNTTTSTFTLDDADEPGPTDVPIQVTVKARQGSSSGTVLAEDVVSIFAIQDGSPTTTAILTNEAHTVVADKDGVVSSFSGAGGTFKVFHGNTDITSNAKCTFAVQSETGVDVSIDSATGVYTVNSMSAGTGTATFRATVKGSIIGGVDTTDDVTRDKIYTIAKSQTGATGDQGPAGAGALSGFLTNESASAAYYGSHKSVHDLIVSYVNTGGEFKVFEGTSEKTSGVAYSITGGSSSSGSTSKTQNGVTLTINESTGVYTASGANWTTDKEEFTLTGTVGSSVVTKVYVIDKKSFFTITNLTASEQSFNYDGASANPSPSSITLTASPPSSYSLFAGNVYQYKFSKSTDGGSSFSTVQDYGTANTLSVSAGAFSLGNEVFKVEVRNAYATTSILDDDQITLIRIKEGADGSTGADGDKTAVAKIYQTTTSDSAPAVINDTSTYTFSTGLVTNSNGMDGWSNTIPNDADSKFLWTCQAVVVASGSATTGSILTSAWSTPVKQAQPQKPRTKRLIIYNPSTARTGVTAPTNTTSGTPFNFETNTLTIGSGGTSGWTNTIQYGQHWSSLVFIIEAEIGGAQTVTYNTPFRHGDFGFLDRGDFSIQIPDDNTKKFRFRFLPTDNYTDVTFPDRYINDTIDQTFIAAKITDAGNFRSSIGAGTLSSIGSSDVTSALGFTPYNATNPSGFITGITSSNVTTALGFTPYNSTNPSGFITGITSSNVTTALGFTPYNSTNPSGFTANGTSINSSGNLTGTMTIGSNITLDASNNRILITD